LNTFLRSDARSAFFAPVVIGIYVFFYIVAVLYRIEIEKARV
jgi:hypothetical protein